MWLISQDQSWWFEAGLFGREQTEKNMSEQNETRPYSRPITDEAIFKVTKEIVVKFIEVGRLTPANFEETYERVFKTVKSSAKDF